MRLLHVLGDSLSFLIKQPLFFLPGLVSTTLWNVYFLLFLKEFGSNILAVGVVPLDTYTTFLAGSVLLSVVSIILLSTYPTLVKSYKKNKTLNFAEAFNVSVSRLPRTFVTVFVPVVLTSVLVFFTLTMAIFGLLTANLLFTVIGGVLTLVVLVATAVYFYFAPSSVIIDNAGVREAFRTSFRMSRKNPKEITYVVLLSLGLFFIALVGPEFVRTASVAVFLLLRYVTSVASIYLSIVNPSMYLEFKRR